MILNFALRLHIVDNHTIHWSCRCCCKVASVVSNSVRPHRIPGSPIPGILQARTLEWVAISFSTAWKWKVKVKLLSHVRPSATPWTAAFQAPLSMGFSRQEYWSGLPLPSLYTYTIPSLLMLLSLHDSWSSLLGSLLLNSQVLSRHHFLQADHGWVRCPHSSLSESASHMLFCIPLTSLFFFLKIMKTETNLSL